jgi:hypothetical protein
VISPIVSVAGIGLVLGFRHAFEPDHLATVTTLAARPGRVLDAARLGLSWAIGHTATITVAALLTIALGLHLPERLWPAAELVVAVSLVTLGASAIVQFLRGRWHLHSHSHDGVSHLHLHSHARSTSHAHAHPATNVRWALGFGLLHGLAGSGAVLALLVATVPGRAGQWACLAAFGLGTVLGMLTVSAVLWGMVRAASQRSSRWFAILRLGSATASVVVGTIMVVETLRAR